MARPHSYRPPVPAEQKQQIIAGALARIEAGDTIEACAAEHGIHKKTLKVWLLDIGDEYAQFRSRLIDTRLVEAEEEMVRASEEIASATPDELPRARAMLESAKARMATAQWYAERRDRRYASKQEVAVTHRLDLADALAEADRRIGAIVDNSVIDGTCSQVIHSSDEDNADRV
jgi:hypothetical protein